MPGRGGNDTRGGAWIERERPSLVIAPAVWCEVFIWRTARIGLVAPCRPSEHGLSDAVQDYDILSHIRTSMDICGHSY